jgi:hypothetical protein
MFSIRPIKQIKGLFSSYKNEQPVPADEYNANIRCMQQAIEHNGQLLEEHSEAFESLSKEKLPNNAVQTDLIADGAVTADKLSPDVQQQLKMSADSISSYFQDFLLQHHKSKPDMQGVFMNGSIIPINVTLSRQTTYTKTVTQLKSLVSVENPADEDGPLIQVPYQNSYAPATYKVGVSQYYTDGRGIKGVDFSWLTRYVLDQAYDVNTATDTLSVAWNYQYQEGTGSSCYNTGRGTCIIRLKDINDNVIATLPETELNSYQTSDYNWRRTIGANLSSLGSRVLSKVQIIEIETSYTDYAVSSYRYNFIMSSDQHPTLSVNMRFGTGTSERMLHEALIPVSNNHNYVAIGAYVKATTTVDFNTYKFNMAPYCVGECPYQPAPGFESTVLAYVDETADSEYSAVLTDSTAKRYYIRHNFQAPLVISARIKSDKPADLHPDFIAGEYYSWPLHFIDNSYIAYANLNEVIQDLKEYFSDYLEDITYTEYSLGNAQLGVQFNTTTNNITVESVSAAKYAGLTKPNLI